MTGSSSPAPRRVRVTSPRRDAHPRQERQPAHVDLATQTGLGEVYLSTLMRTQLRLSLVVLAGVAAVLGGLPALFSLVPATRMVRLGPLPLSWIVVGILIYPLIALVARGYVRQAERIERDFIELMSHRS